MTQKFSKMKKKLNLIFSFTEFKKKKKLIKSDFDLFAGRFIVYKNLKSQFPDVLQVPCRLF